MRRIGRRFAGALLAVVMGLALTAPASAQAPTLDGVQITGDPVVGSTLTAVIAGTVDPSGVAYRWCHPGDRAPDKCAKGSAIGSGPVYVPLASDLGRSLLVEATATIGTFEVKVRSAPVTVASPPELTPQPTPEPTPDPTPTPTPTPTAPAPTFASVGEPSAVPTLLAATGSSVDAAAPLRFLTPFPVVRIRGSVAARGALINMLRVTASPNVTVHVRCDGSSCPVRRRSRAPGRIHALERYLSAGTRITIRARRRGYIGKYVRIVIRAGAAPFRRDACVVPGSSRPVSCGPT